MKEKIVATAFGTIIGSIVASIIPALIGGLMLKIAWNAVAFECNLPQFGYWACVGAFYVPYAFISAMKRTSKD